MRAFRIFLAGLGVACGSATVLAQNPLLSTKPTVPAPTASAGQFPPMSSLMSTAQPTDLLTAPATGLPSQSIPGAVYSPWCGDQPAGALGTGANGPVTYELYARSGPSFIAESGGFNGTLQTGYVFQGGGRTLLFNPAGDAAWVFDIGLSYTYNKGNGLANPIRVSANSLKGSDPADDFTFPLGVRALKRTSLNFGLGREWFLNGPGVLGQAPDTNWRFGTDIGGRWGTASVGFEPVDEPGGYRRRQGVFHGIYMGTGINWEKNFGGWIFLAGFRAEYSYNWTNLIPPLDGDIQDVNLLGMIGVRF